MPTIIPSERRVGRILRNANLFQNKTAAISTFTNINNNSALGTLYDGEVLSVRYVAGFSASQNVWTEIEPNSAVASTSLRNVEILNDAVLSGSYPENTIFMLPHGGGTYDAYTKQQSSAGDNVTSNAYTHLTSGNNIYCIMTLFGVVSITDNGRLKFTFIDGNASGNNGLPVISTDKSITVTDDGTSYDLSANIDNNTIVKDSSTGVLSVPPVHIALYGENAIEIGQHPSTGTADGRTIKLKIETKTPQILTQSANGLTANLTLVEYTTTDYDGTTTLPASVSKRYRLRTAGTSDHNLSSNIGDPIDIPVDRNLYQVYLGHVDDTLTSSTDPTVISGTGNDALCFIYNLSDGTYQLVPVDIESYLTESEFSDGLSVTNHVVTANLGYGLVFDSSSPKKIQANIGTGLQFDNSSPKKIELKNSATSEIGGIRVGAVKGTAVSGLSTAVENAITTDTTPTASNLYRRYAVLSDVNGLGYINIPSLGPNTLAQYSTTAASALPLTGVDNLLVLDSNGQISTLNVWDCGTYNNL